MKELNRLLQQLADNIREARKSNEINDDLEGAESDIAEVQALVKNLAIPDVSQCNELLICVDKANWGCLTEGKKYTVIFKYKDLYFLEDDDFEVYGYDEKYFKIVEAN